MLNHQQKRFVAEFLVDLNAREAYIRAGYSKRSAAPHASRLMKDPEVAEAIERAMRMREARTQITQDRVLQELARIAFGDLRRVMNWNAGALSLKDSATLSDDDAAIVAEVAETTTQFGASLRIKTHSKVAALELIGRHLGMFKDKVEVTGNFADIWAGIVSGAHTHQPSDLERQPATH